MDFILNILVHIFLIIAIIVFPFVLSCCFWWVFLKFIKRVQFPKYEKVRKVKERPVLARLFIDFPKQFVIDRLNFNPNAFGYFGFWLFVGEQGSGKTVSAVEFLQRIKREYPLSKCATNFGYKAQDSAIEDWRDIVFRNNGVEGQVDVIDEVQNWFSCNESKDFPPEMLQEITQQRKQRKMFIGTTQRFERMAKPLREQVNYLCKPFTLAGCLTIVRVYKPTVDDEGAITKLRPIKTYFFVQNEEIRNAFDTYQKITMQSVKGFHSGLRDNDNKVVVNTTINTARKK